MIRKIRLLNYKKFKAQEIAFDWINVFVGANGSGKSSVSHAIYSLATIIRLGIKAAFPEGLLSFTNVVNFKKEDFGYKFPSVGLGIEGELNDFEFEYDIVFNKNSKSPSGFYVNFERLKITGEEYEELYQTGRKPESSIYDFIDDRENWPDMLSTHPQRDSVFVCDHESLPPGPLASSIFKIKRHMQRISKFQFSPAAARSGYEQYDGDRRQPFLKTDGSNLAAVVQYLQEEERGGMNNLKNVVIKYAEGASKIVDIGISNYDERAYLNFYEEGINRRSVEVRGPSISDGYWVFTAFACLASCSLVPTWAFFEEPESYLHPHKLPLLYEIFEKLAYRDENRCQVALSTHSPYLLDLFKDHTDTIFLLKDGEITTLSNIPNYKDIISLQSLGDAWYSNIFGGGNPC